MTYKEIINRFREVVEDHFMLVDFGYGELSDIKTDMLIRMTDRMAWTVDPLPEREADW